MKLKVQDIHGRAIPDFELEGTPLESAQLMGSLLVDAEGQEDFYLGEIAKAEAGETILDLYNHYIHLYLYPEVAILEDMWDPEPIDDVEPEGPRRCIRMSLAETRKLLEDWLAVKEKWCEEHHRQKERQSASSPLPPAS